MAAIRESCIRNTRRVETLLRQNAQLLVDRDIDILILSKPRTSTEPIRPPLTPSIPSSSEKGKGRERPLTPFHPKVDRPGPSRIVIDLCTPEPPSIHEAKVGVLKPFYKEPAGRNHTKHCSICREPGHYRRTCTAPRCPYCGKLKKTHQGNSCPIRRSDYLRTRRTPLNDTRVGDITCNYPGPMGKPPDYSDDDYDDLIV